MLRRPSRWIATLITAVLMLLAVPTAASAAADGDSGSITWSVRPADSETADGRAWIELEVDPGESVQEHLIVTNFSDHAVTFSLSAADGYFTDSGRFNMLPSDQTSTRAGTWIAVADSVTLGPGAAEVVPFTVNIPDNAEPGDHLAGVAASVRSSGSGAVGVESRVGFRVMTRVSGELQPRLESSVDASYTGSINPFEPGDIDVTYSITNAGNTRLHVSPTIIASGLFAVRYEAAGEAITEIAPGETRTATMRIANVWPLFAFTTQIDASATPVTEELAVGEVETSPASTLVVAVPWPQLITVGLLVLLVFGFRWDRRRKRRDEERRLDMAREEGRIQAEQAAKRGVPAALMLALATALVLGPAVAASAETPPISDQSPSVDVQVEISPLPELTTTPEPTTTPRPSTSPDPNVGALPMTGVADSLVPAAAGVLAILSGILVHRARRRVRSASGDPRDS